MTAQPTPPAPADPAALADEVLGAPLAEAAVLGCLFRMPPGPAAALLAGLQESDWVLPQHAHIAAAAAVLLARGEPADPVTVLGQLRRQGVESARASSKDAAVLLVELCASAPSVANAGYYTRIVLEHAHRRRVQQAAVRLLHAAEHASLPDLDHVVAREQRALAASRCRSRPAVAAAPRPEGEPRWPARLPA